MKIAFIYDCIYPYVKGGIEKRIYEISKRLVKKGHEIHWYGIKWWKNGDTIKNAYDVYLHGIFTLYNSLYTKSGKRRIDIPINFAIRLFKKLIKYKFDIIDCQVNLYFPVFTSKFLADIKKEKLILTWHEVWEKYWYNYLGRLGFFGEYIEKIVSKINCKHISVSKKTKNRLYELGLRKHVDIIPNGIDFKKIKKIKKSNAYSDIIFIGRLIKDKNIELIIKSIRYLKDSYSRDIKCFIIGDGPEKKKLVKLVNELKLNNNIKFFGKIKEYEKVISILKSSKIFVFPSLREGFGIVVIEANACGLPVLTVNYPLNAATDLIHIGRNGYICKPSYKDFAENMLILLSKYRKMKSDCIKIAKKYDWDEICKKLETVYKDYLQSDLL